MTNKVESEDDDECCMDTTSGSEGWSDEENDEVYDGDEGIINVEFEERIPIDPDLNGIKQMLGRLFVKAHVDLSEMAGVIIGQNYVGRVLKEAYKGGRDDDKDEDTDMEDPCQKVFGVTTVINLSNKQDLTYVRQLQKMIFEKAEKYATEQVVQQFREALEGGTKTTGLLLNERFINIPAAVCVPMMENLLSQIERARSLSMPYTFDYYLMFVKYFQKAAEGDQPTEVIYINDEEEYFIKDSCASFDYSVHKETTTALAGHWQKKDEPLQPFRKVLLIEASKLAGIVSTIKNLVPSIAIKDFEESNPIDTDLDGLKLLLGPLFVKAHVDLSEIAGVIIGQNYVGSVLKQAYNNNDEDDEDEDTDVEDTDVEDTDVEDTDAEDTDVEDTDVEDTDMDADLEDTDMEDRSQTVFGVTTVINLSNKQDLTCVRQLQKMIFEKAEKYATELVIQQFREALEGGTKTTGLLLNERFIKIPAAVCVPMMENLLSEMERARSKSMPYTFDYYLMFVKYLQKAAAGDKPAEVIYINDEEEYFIKDSCASFDYSVQEETTIALAKRGQKKDEQLQSFRKVLLIEANKLAGIVSMIKNLDSVDR